MTDPQHPLPLLKSLASSPQTSTLPPISSFSHYEVQYLNRIPYVESKTPTLNNNQPLFERFERYSPSQPSNTAYSTTIQMSPSLSTQVSPIQSVDSYYCYPYPKPKLSHIFQHRQSIPNEIPLQYSIRNEYIPYVSQENQYTQNENERRQQGQQIGYQPITIPTPTPMNMHMHMPMQAPSVLFQRPEPLIQQPSIQQYHQQYSPFPNSIYSSGPYINHNQDYNHFWNYRKNYNQNVSKITDSNEMKHSTNNTNNNSERIYINKKNAFNATNNITTTNNTNNKIMNTNINKINANVSINANSHIDISRHSNTNSKLYNGEEMKEAKEINIQKNYKHRENELEEININLQSFKSHLSSLVQPIQSSQYPRVSIQIQNREDNHLSQEPLAPIEVIRNDLKKPNIIGSNRLKYINWTTKRGSKSWSVEEDKLLRRLKEVEKKNWNQIARYFPDRTTNGCQFRWRRLRGRDIVASKKIIYVQDEK